MEVAGVASQWRVVAGAGSPLSSIESIGLRGRRLVPGSKSCALLGSRSSRRSASKEAGGLLILAMAAKQKKVNAFDDGWKKEWFGAGMFAETLETEQQNIVTKLEKKKLLSKVEKAGLLSKAESAGLSLSTIEKWGLLSKAESLGLLSLAENFATAPPGFIASLSLVPFIASILAVVLVPGEPPAVGVLRTVLALLFLGLFVGLFVGSIFLSDLQEDDF